MTESVKNPTRLSDPPNLEDFDPAWFEELGAEPEPETPPPPQAKFPTKPLPAVVPPNAEITYQTIESLPICEIEGGIPITDQYLTEVQRVWFAPKKIMGDKKDWVYFSKPGEAEADPDLKNLENPSSDDALRRIQFAQNDFKYAAPLGRLGEELTGQSEIQAQRRLCRSDKPHDGKKGYRIWAYEINKVLERKCEANDQMTLRPLPDIKLTDQEKILLVSLGDLTQTQFCSGDDWSGKFHLTSHLPTIDFLKKRIMESDLFPKDRAKEIIEEIELAVKTERDIVNQTWWSFLMQPVNLFVGAGSLLVFYFLWRINKRQVQLQEITTDYIKETNKKPVITDFATDRVEEMRQKLTEDPTFQIVGRDAEARALMETLARPEYANTIVEGPTGAGKDVVVDKVAFLIAKDDPTVPAALRGKKIWRIDPTDIQAGTQYRGSFADKVALTKAEMVAGNVAYFPELPDQMNAGAVMQSQAESLVVLAKEILTKEWSRWVGTGTPENTQLMMRLVPDLRRRLKPQYVDHMRPSDILQAMREVAKGYAKTMNVDIRPDAIVAATRLGIAYLLPEQEIPPFDAAKNALMDAISLAKRGNGADIVKVGHRHVVEALGERLNMSIDEMAGAELFTETKKGGGPKGPDGGSEPPSAAAGSGEEAAPAKEVKGNGDGEVHRVAEAVKIRERFGGILEISRGPKGFAAFVLPFVGLDVAEDSGVISSDQKTGIIATLMAGMIYLDRATPGHLALLTPAFELGGIGAEAGMKAAGIKENSRWHKPLRTVGSFAGAEGFITAVGKGAGAPTLTEAHHTGRRVLQDAVVNMPRYAREGWQTLSTGLRMYGKEAAAVASGYATAIQAGASVLLRAGSKFVTPIFMVGNLEDYFYDGKGFTSDDTI